MRAGPRTGVAVRLARHGVHRPPTLVGERSLRPPVTQPAGIWIDTSDAIRSIPRPSTGREARTYVASQRTTASTGTRDATVSVHLGTAARLQTTLEHVRHRLSGRTAIDCRSAGEYATVVTMPIRARVWRVLRAATSISARRKSADYDAREYWERRLAERFNVRGVGHIDFSEAYNEWLYRRKADCLERALTGTDLRNKTVLDVGCGTGFFVRWYGERGAKVHGIDITDVSVSRLREDFPQHRFDVADIGSADYPLREQFDIVNIWDVLYHVVEDRRFYAALRNLAASVGAGGCLLVTDQLGGPDDIQDAAHVKRRCLARYQSVLPAEGLQLEQLLPLYCKLNERRAGEPPSDAAAAEYYRYDSTSGFIASRNLSVGVWRRE